MYLLTITIRPVRNTNPSLLAMADMAFHGGKVLLSGLTLLGVSKCSEFWMSTRVP